MGFIRTYAVLLAVTTVLFNVFQHFVDNVLNIALFLLAVVAAYLLLTLLWYILPRSYLPDLDKRAVFITGCDTGFGNQLAKKLDSKGVTVYAGCLFAEGEGATQLKKDCSNRLKIVSLDITNDDNVKKSLKFVQETIGDKKLWALVNNAGIFLYGGAEYVTLQACRRLLEVNLLGHINMTQTFLPMLRRSRGRVVFTSSLASTCSVTFQTAYAMTKAALSSFAEGLRREMRPWSVTVHTVNPVIYSTAMSEAKALLKNALIQWDHASDQVKSDYGERYAKHVENYGNTFRILYQPAHKTYEVVDDLEHAAIGLHPKMKYVPGLWGLFVTTSMCSVPKDIADIQTDFVFPFQPEVHKMKH